MASRLQPLASSAAALRGASRGAEVAVGFAIGPPSDTGWTCASALLDDAEHLGHAIEATRADAGTARRDIAASLLLRDWSFGILVRTAACLLSARRIPSLRLDEIWLLRPRGCVEAVAFSGAFTCLPVDDAASHAEATVVADESALLACLRAEVERHHAPLVERLHQRCRRPRSALWRHVADALAEAFLWAGEALDERAPAWALGEQVMDGTRGRLAGAANYRLWHVDGHEAVGRVRAQCCLSYRCEPSTYCFSCPLKGEAHREALVRARHTGVEDGSATVEAAA